MDVETRSVAETVVWRVRHQAKFWTEDDGGALGQVRGSNRLVVSGRGREWPHGQSSSSSCQLAPLALSVSRQKRYTIRKADLLTTLEGNECRDGCSTQVHLGRSSTLSSQIRTTSFMQRSSAYLDSPPPAGGVGGVEMLRSPGGSMQVTSPNAHHDVRNMPRMGRDASMKKFAQLESRAERKEEVKHAARIVRGPLRVV